MRRNPAHLGSPEIKRRFRYSDHLHLYAISEFQIKLTMSDTLKQGKEEL